MGVGSDEAAVMVVPKTDVATLVKYSDNGRPYFTRFKVLILTVFATLVKYTTDAHMLSDLRF